MLWFRNDIYPNVDENFELPIVFKKLNGNRDTINKRHIVDSRVENPKQTRCYYKAFFKNISHSHNVRGNIKFNNVFSSNHGA